MTFPRPYRTACLALLLALATACATVVADPLVELGDAEAAGDRAEIIRLSRHLLSDNTARHAASAGTSGDLRIDLAETLIAHDAYADAMAAYEATLNAHLVSAPDDFATEIALRTRIAEIALELNDAPRAETELAIAAKQIREHLGPFHAQLAPVLSLVLDTGLDADRVANLSGLADAGLTVQDAFDEASLQIAQANKIKISTTRSLGALPKTDADFDLVKVFYGTSRAPRKASRFIRTRLKEPSAETYFGAKRGDLSTGTVMVSVPRNRDLGEIPKASALRFEFRPDPAKHTILGDLEIHESTAVFLDQLNAELGRSARKEAFVFIHGYNNDFPTAVERTAQLAIDLEVDGAPVLYSWPSAGSVFSYRADRKQIVPETIDQLKTFLTLVAQASNAEHVHVVAHSMGNEFLLSALQALADEAPAAPLFEQVVFASPDVDADDFTAALTDLPPLASNMTLYASSKDKALQASRRFNRTGRRAGESDEPLILEGLTTIDTTVASTGGLGHTDIFGDAFTDFQAVLWHSFQPEQRCLLSARTVSAGIAWIYGQPREDFCGQSEFSTAITTLRRLGPDKTVSELEDLATTAEARKDPTAERWKAALRIVQMVQ